MKKSKFTEEEMTWALKQADLGTPVEEVCRKLGIANPSYLLAAQDRNKIGHSDNPFVTTFR